ncbi:hypothetical protein ID875_28380 [Streptomyces globisporus]|uniref:Uncharacterized protein n=1 Tax=Streptomyces globisporus TaxID=1908 RepID=A0A927BPM5_STRGL|nr:hypothetical protein [Streptomyces globisporus]
MMMVTGSEDSRDLRQLDDLSALTHRVVDKGLRPLEAEHELTRIISRKGFWPWWTTVLEGRCWRPCCACSRRAPRRRRSWPPRCSW